MEIVNQLSIGLSSFNVKHSVPTDIPENNGYIAAENLKTQKYLSDISEWTERKIMKLNTEKTRIMIFNYTINHQFTTRVTIDNGNIEVLPEAKLLGTHMTNDLKRDVNTAHIVKKSNARMPFLRKIASFGASQEDMKHIYTLFVRSSLLGHPKEGLYNSVEQKNSDVCRCR